MEHLLFSVAGSSCKTEGFNWQEESVTDSLREYDSICHQVLWPMSRAINSASEIYDVR